MNAPSSPTSLRPLGLGELLDRAVSLCVKFFVPLALIQLAYAVPTGIMRYFATGNYTALIQGVIDEMKAGTLGKPGSSDALASSMSQNGSQIGWSFGLLLLWFFISPLIGGALVAATTSAYLGRVPTVAQAYRVGVARWLNMIGVNLLYLLSGGALYIVAVLGIVVVVLALAAVTATARTLGIAVDVVIGTVMVLGGVAFFILVWMAVQMSYFACVVEGANFAAAYVSGLSRIARGIGIRRALLVGIAYFAAMIGIEIVSFAGQVALAGLLHSAIAGDSFITILAIATDAFSTAFMTIFYYDLRVREEGLDLQIAAEAMLARPVGVS